MTPEALGGTRLLPLDPARAYHLELFEWSVWWAAGLLITPPCPPVTPITLRSSIRMTNRNE